MCVCVYIYMCVCVCVYVSPSLCLSVLLLATLNSFVRYIANFFISFFPVDRSSGEIIP